MIVYEVVKERLHAEIWRVVAIDPFTEEVYSATFSGPEAEKRARDYAAWMNGIRG